MTWKQFVLIFIDIIGVIVASYGSLILRFNGEIDAMFIEHINNAIVWFIILDFIIFLYKKLYHSIWQYASITELKNILIAMISSTLVNIVICEISGNPLPGTCYFIMFLLLTMCIGGSRFVYRLLRFTRNQRKSKRDLERVMIIGAGLAGEKVYKEISTSPNVYKEVICFIDDNPNKKTKTIHNIPIVGGKEDILEAVEKYKIEEILVAMPSVDKQHITDILNICKETKCKTKTLPGIYQFVNGNIHLSDFKDVEIQDLLGRDPIKVNLDEIMGYVKDQVVLVTGGGGSIGSELCRQIASSHPKQLIIVDIYENNAYDIQLELKRKYPELNLETMIASVRDLNKMKDLFETYHPDIVYHAAAHKHVPLMEDAPHEAIKNNVFGTYNVALVCDMYQVKKFVLISTDKAVNPTNIMGASKRLCEMIVQSFNTKSNCEYVAVRFGNVLGSNGSVIPLFKKQIKNGGPVTVTHPDIIRYFMTIPEAVSLVLQAGAYARGGEIFVLDMGEPVKIVDMARNLIKLSGYEPDVDIKIEFTGLRPGEKLYEEMLMKEEGMKTTPNKLIHIGNPIDFNHELFLDKLDHLYELAYDEESNIREAVKQLVSTYQYENKKATPKRIVKEKVGVTSE